MTDPREPKRVPGTNMWVSPPCYDDGRYSRDPELDRYDPETWSGCLYDLVRIGGGVVLGWVLAFGILCLIFWMLDRI